jgi:hypothetical protein
MIKYQIGFLILFCFLQAAPVRCQTIDSTENLADSENHFIAPVTQNISIPETIREVPKQRIDKYLGDPDYAYAYDSVYWKVDPPAQPGPVSKFLLSKIFRWFFFITMVAIVLFGFYQIALDNNFNWFFRRRANWPKGGREEIEDGESERFDLLISKYQSEGNFRLAIRYLYLRLIRTAIENKNIQIVESSTNSMIARSFSNQNLSADFQYLANAFEYVFYGGFSPDHRVYENLKNKFDQFQELLLR